MANTPHKLARAAEVLPQHTLAASSLSDASDITSPTTTKLLQVRLNFVGKNLGKVLNVMSMPLFLDQFNRIGIGICVRDDKGVFVLAKGISITPVCPIPAGEALSLLCSRMVGRHEF